MLDCRRQIVYVTRRYRQLRALQPVLFDDVPKSFGRYVVAARAILKQSASIMQLFVAVNSYADRHPTFVLAQKTLHALIEVQRTV